MGILHSRNLRLHVVLLGVAVFALPLSCARKTPPRPYDAASDVRVIRDLRYHHGKPRDALRQSLDIYLPTKGKGWPTLILVHGGAWVLGGKRLVGNVGYALAQKGVATVCVNYRLTPRVRHPGHVEDVARAIAWTRKNLGDYGADTKALFLAGHSAGGHLVSLVALDERYLEKHGLDARDLAGVITISGVYDIDHEVLKEVFGTSRKAWREASPITYVHGQAPPFLILYAERDMDRQIPLMEQAEELFEALRDEGVPARIQEISGTNHAGIIAQVGRGPSETLAAIMQFIDAHAD